MGEVYRARDTKLNRDVALKILPDAFAGDPDRLARFIREAQTLASLNHPNIAIIHGGTGTAERLTKPEQGTSHVPESWFPDGKRFLFAATKDSSISLWAFVLEDKTATPFGDVQSGTRLMPSSHRTVVGSRTTPTRRVAMPSTSNRSQPSEPSIKFQNTILANMIIIPSGRRTEKSCSTSLRRVHSLQSA